SRIFFEKLNRLCQPDEEQASAAARDRMFAIRRSVEIVSDTQLIPADGQIAPKDEYLFAPRMVVCRVGRIWFEFQKQRHLARRFIVAKYLLRYSRGRELPLRFLVMEKHVHRS